MILGPLNDIAMEKLTREMPDEYEVAGGFLALDTFLLYVRSSPDLVPYLLNMVF